jgi:hypothetical protein
MKLQLRSLITCFCALLTMIVAPSSAVAADAYKEPLDRSALRNPPVVYARAKDNGFRVQWLDEASYKDFLSILAASAGPEGLLVSWMIDPPKFRIPAMEDAKRLSPAFRYQDAQRDLEAVLADRLHSLPMFAAPGPKVKTLAPGGPVKVHDFSEEPVLVVETTASLVPDYRALEVTAYAYMLSSANAAANAVSPASGRIYLNRFTYVGDRLPAPVLSTKEHIEAEEKAIEARYPGKLTKDQRANRGAELRALKRKGTADEYRDILISQWLADDGVLLRDNLHAGTVVIADLLAKDLVDASAVTVAGPHNDRSPLTLEESVSRKTVRFVSGRFPGSVASFPADLQYIQCTGASFDRKLSEAPPLVMCTIDRPGSICRRGFAPTPDGCKRIMKKTKETVARSSQPQEQSGEAREAQVQE